jgi:thiosulfate/3-mercaptopyruvate sulfurtransferase
MWLVEHLNDPNIVILDSRGNVAYSYGHIPNSQPLGVEKVIMSNQWFIC